MPIHPLYALDGKIALILRVNSSYKAEKTLKENNIATLSQQNETLFSIILAITYAATIACKKDLIGNSNGRKRQRKY